MYKLGLWQRLKKPFKKWIHNAPLISFLKWLLQMYTFHQLGSVLKQLPISHFHQLMPWINLSFSSSGNSLFLWVFYSWGSCSKQFYTVLSVLPIKDKSSEALPRDMWFRLEQVKRCRKIYPSSVAFQRSGKIGIKSFSELKEKAREIFVYLFIYFFYHLKYTQGK